MPAQIHDNNPKPFYIGIDSDGTVFDSMEIKHKKVFQPIAIEIWSLPEADLYCSICEKINLYSVLRGINRFEGLALAFKRFCEVSLSGREALHGHQTLQSFVDSGSPLSLSALEDYNASRSDTFLEKVITWSRRSDELYARIMEDEGTPSYPGIREILERASAMWRDRTIICFTSDHGGVVSGDAYASSMLPLRGGKGVNGKVIYGCRSIFTSQG